MYVHLNIFKYKYMQKCAFLPMCLPTWNDLNQGPVVRDLGFVHLSGKLHFAEMWSTSLHHGSDKYKRLEELKFLDIQNQTPWR